MILIDLSRDIEHKMAVLPNHPQVIVTPFATHDEVRVADGYGFSSATMALVMGDHAGTHVDAPKHFNADPKAPCRSIRCRWRTSSPRRSASTCRTSR